AEYFFVTDLESAIRSEDLAARAEALEKMVNNLDSFDGMYDKNDYIVQVVRYLSFDRAFRARFVARCLKKLVIKHQRRKRIDSGALLLLLAQTVAPGNRVEQANFLNDVSLMMARIESEN
ncbi:MAG: hypothetical protein ABIH50_06585, partial [bacterium]